MSAVYCGGDGFAMVLGWGAVGGSAGVWDNSTVSEMEIVGFFSICRGWFERIGEV